MHSKSTTKIEINKVRISFTRKKITAYGGFSLLAAFFEKIHLKEAIEATIPLKEISPNSIGIYSKILAYTLMIYAGGSRFAHLLYLGCQDILSELFAVGRLPLASTTLTRLFGKIKTMKEVEKLSDGLWRYISKLIPWKEIEHDWLTFDSTVLERYGKQEGVKRGYNPKKKGRGSHSPLLAFVADCRMVANCWLRAGDAHTANNFHGFLEDTLDKLSRKQIGLLRADSGFFSKEVVEYLERQDRPIHT